MEEIQIQKVFKQLKEIPPELDITLVEKFILAQPISAFATKAVFWIKLKYLLTIKNLMIMLTVTTIITSVLILLTANHSEIAITNKKETTKNNIQQNEILQQKNKDKIESNLNMIGSINLSSHESIVPVHFKPILPVMHLMDSAKKSNANQPVMQSISIINSSSDSSENLAISITNKNGVSSYAYSTDDTLLSIITLQNQSGPRIVLVSECDKGNSYQKVIEETLTEDKIIQSDKKYTYKISNTIFKVNGVEQSELNRVKYLKLLTENSCLELESEFYFKFEKSNNKTSVELSTAIDE